MTGAVEILEDEAYYSDRLKADAIEEVVQQAAAGSLDKHAAVASLVELLGDGHSRLLSPSEVRSFVAPPEAPLPSGSSVGEGVGLLRLPSTLASPITDEGRAYVDAAWSVFRNDPSICSWILDLRGNSGGTIVTMLAAVAPLLGGGRALGLVTRSSEVSWWAIGEDRLTFADATVFMFERTPPSRRDAEVVVMTDGNTASAAEGLVISLLAKGARSIGSATAGVSTVTELFTLGDGAGLLVATAAMVPPRGDTVDGAIPPTTPLPGDGDLVERALELVTPCQ